jgi:hypothetical protein
MRGTSQTPVTSTTPSIFFFPQVLTVDTHPCWGAGREDTIFDAVVRHYQSIAPAGTHFSHEEALADPDGPIGRMLRTCKYHQASTKVACFSFFCGLSERIGSRHSLSYLTLPSARLALPRPSAPA